MIKSMTGFGRAVLATEQCDITVELRAVNHRYLDVNVRSPRLYTYLEDPVKQLVQAQIGRGKVDVYLSLDFHTEDSVSVRFNEKVAESYLVAGRQMSEKYGLANDFTTATLARFPEVFTLEKSEVDGEALIESVKTAAGTALAEFDAMRVREGEGLLRDILGRLTVIEELTAQIERRSPQTVTEYRARLEARMREVLDGAGVEEGRILAEAALFADRTAVAEETVRLHSHCDGLREILASGGAVGRKLDFLVQELHREANTIGSKGNDAEMARLVIELKSEIEKIREQVQNIE